MMLNCIPGVSTKVSTRIVEKYETMQNFIESLKNISSDRVNHIQLLKMSTDENARKISKTAATNIVKYLGFIVQ